MHAGAWMAWLLFLFLTLDSAFGAFGLTTTSTYYQVDCGSSPSLVFRIRRSDSSSTTSVGDIMSLKYNGTEYQDQSRGSQINSGFDHVFYTDDTVSLAATTIGTDYIKITVTVTNGSKVLTHYYMAKKGEPRIYMATHFNAEPVYQALVRYILRLPSDNLDYPFNVYDRSPRPSDIRNNTGAIESADVYGMADGTTRSKHYSGMRLRDWNCIGATNTKTSPTVGCWMVRDNNEGSSGGPFYRSLINQCGSDQEITYIVNYGEGQTEDYRFNILNGYTLVFTNGGAPPSSIDTSFFSGMGLLGYIAPSGRGTVTCPGITGCDTGSLYTVHFYNATAQYYTDASAANGSFTMAGMIPGSYTMKVYRGEMAVYTATSVTVAAGVTNALGAIAITDDKMFTVPLWRIGNWDGTPNEFLHADKITWMHPSDVRITEGDGTSAWKTSAYTVGSSSPATGWPCYQWMDVNNGRAIKFNLTAGQLVSSTIRIGITCGFASGRPNIKVNSWSNTDLPSAVTQPDSRTLTVGTYRGNNKTYSFSVPASALVAGTNTLTISVISGETGTEYLSPGYSFDCIDMFQGTAQTFGVPGSVASLTATSSASGVVLNWSAASNTTTYRIRRSLTAGGPYTEIVGAASGTGFTDTTVAVGTTYYYVVNGINTSGSGPNSPEASAIWVGDSDNDGLNDAWETANFSNNAPPITVAATAAAVKVNNSAATVGADGVLFTSASFNMNGGNAVALLITTKGGGSSARTVTFAGQPMNEVFIKDTSVGVQTAAIYYLINPPVTTGAFVCKLDASWATTVDYAYSAISLRNVYGLAGSNTATSTSSANTTPLTVSYTTTVNGGYVLGAAVNNDNTNTRKLSISSGNPDTNLLASSVIDTSSHFHTHGDIPAAGTYTDGYLGQYQRTAIATIAFQANPLAQTGTGDPDSDGYDNEAEETAGTDPNNAASTPADLDGDGLADAWEAANFPAGKIPITVAATAAAVKVNNSAATVGADGVLFTSASFNMNGGNAVAILITTEGGGGSATRSVTFAGQPMQELFVKDSGIGIQSAAIYYLINPAATTGTFVCKLAANYATTVDYAYSLISLKGVAAVAGTDTASSTSTANTTPLPLSYTTTVNGGYVLGAAVNADYNNGRKLSMSSGNPDNNLLSHTVVDGSGHFHTHGDVATAGTYTDNYLGQYARTAIATVAFVPGALAQKGTDDPDGDGFNNEAEETAGTDPNDARFTPADTDGDGLADAWEIANFSSRPLAPITVAATAATVTQNNSAATVGADGVLFTSASFNMNGGTAVAILITAEGAGASSTRSVTFAGQPMKEVFVRDSGAGAQTAAIYYLINPPVTTGQFVCKLDADYPGTVDYAYSPISLMGATGVAASNTAASRSDANTTPLNLTYTTRYPGGYVLGAAVNNDFNNARKLSISSGNPDTNLLSHTVVDSSGHFHTHGDVPTAGTFTDDYLGQFNRTAIATVVFETRSALALSGTDNPDGDAFNNEAEETAGTDPNQTPAITAQELQRCAVTLTGMTGSAAIKASVTGHRYQVQYCDDLTSGNWQNHGSAVIGNGSNLQLALPIDISRSKRFYRVRIQQ